MTSHDKTHLPHAQLHRLAQPAVEILARQGHRHHTLRAFDDTLVPAATAYMDAYAAVCGIRSRHAFAVEREAASVADLLDRTLSWAQVIASDVPSFNPVYYTVRPDITRDVIANARKVVAFASGYSKAEMSLPDASQIVTELKRLIALAQQDADCVEAMLITQQALQRAGRNAAIEFYRQLLLFRRALVRVLGEKHRDCELLNFERARRDDAFTSRTARRRMMRANAKANARRAREEKRAARAEARAGNRMEHASAMG